MNLVSLTAGKYFKTGKKSWLTLEGGVCYVKGEQASFNRTTFTSRNIIIAGSTSSNYKYTIENRTSFGAMLKGDMNWALSSIVAFGFGMYANLNSIQSPVGFQAKLILGNLGTK